MAANFALRLRLAEALCAHIEGLAQVDAAVTLGLHQPAISRLRNGRVEHFSVDRLLELLARQGFDIEIRISRQVAAPKPRIPPPVRVTSIDRFGAEKSLEGRIAPKARHESWWAEEIGVD